MNRHALSIWSALMDYCKAAMAHCETEQFRILFLDRKNVLIADEEQARHRRSRPRLHTRGREAGAGTQCLVLILVHNHPSGEPTPSRADIDMTQQIERAAEAVGVILHDHAIIGKEHNISSKSHGLI